MRYIGKAELRQTNTAYKHSGGDWCSDNLRKFIELSPEEEKIYQERKTYWLKNWRRISK